MKKIVLVLFLVPFLLFAQDVLGVAAAIVPLGGPRLVRASRVGAEHDEACEDGQAEFPAVHHGGSPALGEIRAALGA